jgi:hypothetical protein
METIKRLQPETFASETSITLPDDTRRCIFLIFDVRIIDRWLGRIYSAMISLCSVTLLISANWFRKGYGTVVATLKGAGGI